jgi:hypothetical protein
MSDRELHPVGARQSGLPAPIEWLCGWWARHHSALREANVRELLMAYAEMDEEARAFVLAIAKKQATRWPAVRPSPPTLRLVRTSMPRRQSGLTAPVERA